MKTENKIRKKRTKANNSKTVKLKQTGCKLKINQNKTLIFDWFTCLYSRKIEL